MPEWYVEHYSGNEVPEAARAEQYVKHYTDGELTTIDNESDGFDWRRDFMSRYTEADVLYREDAERIQRQFANTTQHARDCHTLRALNEWRDAQRARIEAFVPKAFRNFADSSLDREFEANEARIEQEKAAALRSRNSSSDAGVQELAGSWESSQLMMDHYAEQWIPHPVASASSTPPEWYINHFAGSRVPETTNLSDGKEWRRSFMNRYVEAFEQYAVEARRIHREFADAPRKADNCRTLEELRRWQEARQAEIRAFVPKTFQGFAQDALEREFETNEARLARQQVNNSIANASTVQLMAGSAEGLQRFMGRYAEQWIPHPPLSADTPPEWYVNDFAGAWMPKHHNASSGIDWRANFTGRFAEAFHDALDDALRIGHEFGSVRQHARSCHTLAELREWRDAQRAEIEAFVPQSFQEAAKEQVEERFAANQARIVRELNETAQVRLVEGIQASWAGANTSPEWYVNRYATQWVPEVDNVTDDHEWQGNFTGRYAEAYQHYMDESKHVQRQLAQSPRHAHDCHTLAALREWRDAQRAQIEAFVPRVFQQLAERDVEEAFEANKARIAMEEVPQRATADTAASHNNASADMEVVLNAEVGWMGWYQQWMPHPSPHANSPPEWYVNHYAGRWARSIHNVSNETEWREHMMGKYAEARLHYAEDAQRIRSEFINATQHARDCHTLPALREWRSAQRAEIQAFVPQIFQRAAKEEVEQTFEANKARILREQQTARQANNISTTNASGAVELVNPLSDASAPLEWRMDQHVGDWAPGVQHMNDGPNSWNDFVGRYSEEWYIHRYLAPWIPEIHNATNSTEWSGQFISSRMEAQRQYHDDEMHIRHEFPDAPRHGRDCHSLGALRQWRAAQRARIQAFVPRAFQRVAKDTVDEEFEANQARIAREAATHSENISHSNESAEVNFVEQAAPGKLYFDHSAGQWAAEARNMTDDHESRANFLGWYAQAYRHYVEETQRIRSEYASAPRHASDCHSLAALKQWRDAQRAEIEAFVPQTFQRLVQHYVEQEFQSSKARILMEEARGARNRSVPSEGADFQLLISAATQQNMDWYEQWVPHPSDNATATPEWYVNHYAGKWVPTAHNVSNGSEWRENFMHKYAEAYRHYGQDLQRIRREFANATQHARDCHTLGELQDWRTAQQAQIEAFVPAAFQRIAMDAVNADFEANKARIAREEDEATHAGSNVTSSSQFAELQLAEQVVAPRNSMEQYADRWIPQPLPASRNASAQRYMGQYMQRWIPHPLPTSQTPPESYMHHNAGQQWREWFMGKYAEASRHYEADFAQLVAMHPHAHQRASDCHSEEELDAWSSMQHAQIQAFVPKTFQSLAEDCLARDTQAQQARLAAEGLFPAGSVALLGLPTTALAAALPVAFALGMLLAAAAISRRWLRRRMALEEEIADYYVQV